MKLKKITYEELNDRQKENYNLHHVAAILAEYGFNTIRLTDDWEGADAIAIHVNGKDALRIQLKGRLAFAKKYQGKGIWIAFQDKKSKDYYLFEHDVLVAKLPKVAAALDKRGSRHMPQLSKEHRKLLKPYKL